MLAWLSPGKVRWRQPAVNSDCQYFKGKRNKTNFWEKGAWKFRKLLLGNKETWPIIFLGNMVPPGRAYLVGLLCTHLGSAQFHIIVLIHVGR